MQRFSINVLFVVLCAACGGPADAPVHNTIPLSNVDQGSGLPAPGNVDVADLSTADGFLRTPTGANWILELDEESRTPTSALAPSHFEASDPTTPVEPRLIIEPGPNADATTVATYVAEAWANSGPGTVPWHQATQTYLTQEFSESINRDHPPVRQLTAVAKVVQATTRPTPTGERVNVTLEQVRSSDRLPWRLVGVEVLVVEVDGRSLVASLKVMA